MRVAAAGLGLLGAVLIAHAAAGDVDVLTYHNDNLRTGQNVRETTLTPHNVSERTFGLLRKLPVDGKVDAQPLVVHALRMRDQHEHDVVFVATEHASVYAFDVDTGTTLWRVSLLGEGETPSDARRCGQVAPEIGITATPVIDRAAGTLYVVAMSKDHAGSYYQRLHALRLDSGEHAAPGPVTIAASVAATGAPDARDGRLQFDPGQYKERSALLLSGGIVYTSWASHCDHQNYTGWIIAYQEGTLRQAAVYNTEPSGSLGSRQGEASFWNSNSGPSADADGNLYGMTANGVFDTSLTADGFPGGNDYGNSILKLKPPDQSGAMNVLDYFTMYDSNAQSSVDGDLGSGGLLLLPDQTDAAGRVRHLGVGAGKDMNIYVVDRDRLGKFNASGNTNAYQFLARAFPSTQCGRGVYGAPVYYNGMVYFASVGDVIRGYRLTAARFPAPAGNVQTTTQTKQSFCYPGASLSVSANGGADGILWAVESSNTRGVLHAYDAADLTHELYQSAESGGRDDFGPGSKYTPPTIANGKVFVGTQADIERNPAQQNNLAIFGLL